MSDAAPFVSLREIFKVFFHIGLTGFGGGMAIVALTERVCVQEKEWVSREEFLHGLAFGQLLGPFSLNTCTFVGYRLRGASGGITAAVAFILPSFLLISLLSFWYFRFNSLPRLQSALKGTNPIIIALIGVAAWTMSRTTLKGRHDWLMALAAFGLFAFAQMSALTVLMAGLAWSLLRCYFDREHC
jgi:chromate transporter